jgi:hypothetical protein
VLAGLGVEEGLRQAEDRLLRAERGKDVHIGVEDDAEPPVDPGDDCLAELGQPGGARVGRGGLDRRDERLADERGRFLPRVAHTEVDQGPALGDRLGLTPVELLERIRLRGSHRR